MNRKWILWGLCILLVLPACGINESTDKQHSQKEGRQLTLDPEERAAVLDKLDKKIVEAQNAFGLRLHQKISKQGTGDNVIISPYSLSAALALAYNGSAGDTAKEIERVLGWSDMGLAQVNDANGQLKSLLEHGGGVTLNIANSVWIQNQFVIKESYLNVVKDRYDAEIKMTDLSHDDSVKEINSWVDQKTNGKITELYKDPPFTKAVLINAVYFNGGWMDEFDPQRTKEENFTLADGTVKRVPMMKQERGFSYKESDKWQAVRLPYGDGRMHMLVVVPSKESSLNELHKELWKDPSIWQDEYSFETVKLELPRFKAELSAELTDVLKAAGIRKAFDPETADFSAMAESPLYIGRVQHKVVVDVKEKGTEAAAVTSIDMPTGAAPLQNPIKMIADRPFFFAIEDRDTETWLFMGSVTNP